MLSLFEGKILFHNDILYVASNTGFFYSIYKRDQVEPSFQWTQVSYFDEIGVKKICNFNPTYIYVLDNYGKIHQGNLDKFSSVEFLKPFEFKFLDSFMDTIAGIDNFNNIIISLFGKIAILKNCNPLKCKVYGFYQHFSYIYMLDIYGKMWTIEYDKLHNEITKVEEIKFLHCDNVIDFNCSNGFILQTDQGNLFHILMYHNKGFKNFSDTLIVNNVDHIFGGSLCGYIKNNHVYILDKYNRNRSIEIPNFDVSDCVVLYNFKQFTIFLNNGLISILNRTNLNQTKTNLSINDPKSIKSATF